MPTPLTPDEEFDAHFRQGLEHYPEQPDDLAAWQRMDLLLDADLRQVALHRRVWRLLSAELVLLLLGTLLVVHWAATRPTASAVASAKATTEKQLALPPTGRPAAGELAPTARSSAAAAAGLSPTSGSAAPVVGAAGTTRSAAAATRGAAGTTRSAVAAAASSAQPASPDSSHDAALLPPGGQRANSQNADHKLVAGALLATSQRRLASGRPLHHTGQPDPVGQSDAASASRLGQSGLPQGLAAQTSRHSANRAGVGRADKPANDFTTQTAQAAQRRYSAERRGGAALRAAARRRGVPLAAAPVAGAAELTTTEMPGPAGALEPLAARYSENTSASLLPDSLAGVALGAWPRPLDSLSQPRPVPAWQANRLRLGVIASPELNSVRASRLTALGGDLGLQLDYQLAPRWHLNAGYLLTLKRYVARGTDYNLPAGYVIPHNWVITDVDAVCRIVDIPINLRYDLVRKQGYQLFASAGLSSLLMRREQYTYGYEPVAGQPIAPYTWELRNGSNHFLKVLNLSAGYERAVGPRWTVQAEPYLKLPLGGVGFGTVRLMSAGVFFSFKYGLLPAH